MKLPPLLTSARALNTHLGQGATNPASSNQAANLLQHKSSGNYVLDLSKEITLAEAVTTTVSAHATTAAGVTTAIVRTGKPMSSASPGPPPRLRV